MPLGAFQISPLSLVSSVVKVNVEGTEHCCHMLVGVSCAFSLFTLCHLALNFIHKNLIKKIYNYAPKISVFFFFNRDVLLKDKTALQNHLHKKSHSGMYSIHLTVQHNSMSLISDFSFLRYQSQQVSIFSQGFQPACYLHVHCLSS